MERAQNLLQYRVTFIPIQTYKFSELVFKIVDENIAVECHKPDMDVMRQFFDHFQQSLL